MKKLYLLLLTFALTACGTNFSTPLKWNINTSAQNNGLNGPVKGTEMCEKSLSRCLITFYNKLGNVEKDVIVYDAADFVVVYEYNYRDSNELYEIREFRESDSGEIVPGSLIRTLISRENNAEGVLGTEKDESGNIISQTQYNKRGNIQRLTRYPNPNIKDNLAHDSPQKKTVETFTYDKKTNGLIKIASDDAVHKYSRYYDKEGRLVELRYQSGDFRRVEVYYRFDKYGNWRLRDSYSNPNDITNYETATREILYY